MSNNGLVIVVLAGCAFWPLAQATGSDTLSRGKCESAQAQTVPSQVLRMRPAQAKQWLAAHGYDGRVVERVLPFQTKHPGRVVSTNPYVGATVCNGTLLWLNVGPPLGLATVAMRDLRHQKPAEALRNVRELLGHRAGRVELLACGQAVPALPAECDEQFRVVKQWPPVGTMIGAGNASAPVRLELEKLGDLSAQEEASRAACGAATGLGWKTNHEASAPLPAYLQSRVSRVEMRPLEPILDRVACEARMVTVPMPMFEQEPERPGAEMPVAPVLLSGALGGALLLHFWPLGRRERRIAAAVNADAAQAAGKPPAPALRVVLDVPRPGP